MSDKMTVLFVKDTGTVVAALTRAADPETKLASDVLAGDALVVRYLGDPTAAGYGDHDFLIEPNQLDVLIPDLDPDVISTPREFSVDSNRQVVPSNAVTTIAPTFPNHTQITITLNQPVTQESKVWVQIVGPGPNDRQVATGKIANAAAAVTIDLHPLQAMTDYDVLAFVQKYAPRRLNVTTP